MAKRQQPCKWNEPNLYLKKEFNEGSYQKLINYSEINAAYKLGELHGILKYLAHISYETNQNNLVITRFELVKTLLLEYSDYFKDVIKLLYEKNEDLIEDLIEDLQKDIPLDPEVLEMILTILYEDGHFVFCSTLPKGINKYILTDDGIRLAKQI